MSDAPTILIASLSARALVRSARRGGFRVLALDCYGDADTYEAATEVLILPCDEGGFQAEELSREVRKLPYREMLSGSVYGSGFEQRPELLGWLAETCHLYGNFPETVLRVKDPTYWSAVLDQLGLKYPETTLEYPLKAGGWLAKRKGGSGGWHVHLATAPSGDDWFYQRRIEGPTYSVLFLADGRHAHIIGFNQQWSYGEVGGYGFGYAGAVSNPELPQSVRKELSEAVAQLTKIFELRGLNGVDFVLGCDSRPYLLELNPRPTATVELWDGDWADGLVAAHIRACDGMLPDRYPESASVRGHAVVYAHSTFVVPDCLDLPGWCQDIPRSGSVVQIGQPFCSVFVEGTHSESVRNLIWFRRDLVQQIVSRAITGGQKFTKAVTRASALIS
jgi:uncharacterized protein